MDKTITTALMIVISMVLALMLFNVAYPAVVEGGDAIASMGRRAEDRLRTQIRVIHAAAEMDGDGNWQDSNGSGRFEAFVWVKNIGSARIPGIDTLDVFFGPEGNFTRIPHQSDADGAFPHWSWQVENATEWTPTATLRITVHYATTPSMGRYFIRVTTPGGVSDEYYMGM
ncbi:MAG: hypothetical protein ACOCXZ_00770 [Chloroflexota bacterium]